MGCNPSKDSGQGGIVNTASDGVNATADDKLVSSSKSAGNDALNAAETLFVPLSDGKFIAHYLVNTFAVHVRV